MKYLVSVLLCLFIFSFTHAQEENRVFNPFRVDVNLGAPIPLGKGNKVGFSIGIEPKYAVNDLIQIGLRMEASIMARGFEDPNVVSVTATANGNYTVTGDYYFNRNKFRPFAGMGLGICRVSSVNVNIKDNNQNLLQYGIASESKFESMIRAGFEYGHGRLAFEYNYVPNSTANSNQYTTLIINNSYFNIKLGIAIGGGHLKK